ncbi:hypothetical protein D9M72_524350 [compost metagenome]
MDLVGPAHDLVGHGFGLADVGDGVDDVAEGGQVLDVDRGEDVDAGVEEFVDVLPPFGMPAAGDVGVGVFVDDGCLGCPGQYGVQIHLIEFGAPVRQPPWRDDFQPVKQRAGVGTSVVQGERDDDVLATFAQTVGFLEHFVGLADSRGGPQENP